MDALDGEPRAAAPALRVEGLAYRYVRHDVWSDVSFSLEAGSIAFLTGPNGAGKSTLLRCLAGWDAPAEGTVELAGPSGWISAAPCRSFPTCPPSTTT